jgi:hypothetical protein
MDRFVSVVVYGDKAVVPTTALTTAGYYLAIYPSFVSDLTLDDLARAITDALAQGTPLVPALTREEFKQRDDPVLKPLKVRSWLALAKKGASFGIEWMDGEISIVGSKLDKRGRFVDDREHEIHLSPSATPEQVAEVILLDLQRRGMVS